MINCQAGDRKALELLVKRWNPNMIRRVFHTTKDITASQDIVQEAWIVIIKKIRALKDPRAFQSWSLKIATYLAIDWIRYNQRDRKREDIRKEVQDELNETSPPPKEGAIGGLKQAISQLPEDQHLVIRMFYLENLSLVTISEIIDVPVGTVKSRLFRGREQLKEILETKFYQNEE